MRKIAGVLSALYLAMACGPAFARAAAEEPALARLLWKDPSGLTWGVLTPEYVTKSEAEAFCRYLGLALPSRQDFERAESAGLRDHLRAVRGKGFWSSTEAYFNAAYAYNGDSGEIGLISIELPVRGALNTAWGVCVKDDRGGS